ncbi:DUF2189 domain-containing protein [Neomegalonema perideroedes]|uniref:DUF2189 domain-containing protein n=1 Tax=Neomegalonema perideroedes TaxID=217219 RepID=UPI00035DE024|nr:DUF2189 domain-containing protein [Neomegalonema perideroedes]
MTSSSEAASPPQTAKLPLDAAFGWLRAGWADAKIQPGLSFGYGAAVCLVSWAMVGAIFRLGWGNALFPALAGFMILGPVVAVGLYEKSRRLERGESVTLGEMLGAGFRNRGQILFVGALLALLGMVWMRAATIIAALFLGWKPVPNELSSVLELLFTTPAGLGMLVVGSLVGALFAGLAFGVGAFAAPMLLDRERDLDAFTAMGVSATLVWRHLPAMLVWGACVLAGFLFALATGLLGLIVVFPLIGHATWRAYEALRGEAAELIGAEAPPQEEGA